MRTWLSDQQRFANLVNLGLEFGWLLTEAMFLPGAG